MKYNIVNNNSILDIEISDSKESYLAYALDKVKNEANIEGFRKGKIPNEILAQRYGNVIESEMVEAFLSKGYSHVLEQENIDVIGQPVILDSKIEKDMLSGKLRVHIFPMFEIPQYTDFNFEKEEVKVEEKEINSTLEYIANKQATIKDVDTKAQIGNIAVIDFQGFTNSEKFTEAYDYDLKLGSGSFIDNFEEQIVGHKIGDEFEVNVVFPKDYHEEKYQGIKAKFTVNLKSVKEVIVPEIDDDLAKSEGYASLKDLRTRLEEAILRNKELQKDEQLFEKIVEKIVETVHFEVPDILLQKELELKQKKMQEKGHKLDDNDLKLLKIKTISELKEILVIREILKKEDISVAEDEIKEHLEKNFNMKYNEVIASEKHERFLDEIYSNIRMAKLKKFLIDRNTKHV